jgi:hypothetical protein
VGIVGAGVLLAGPEGTVETVDAAGNPPPGAFTPAGLPAAPVYGSGIEQYNSFNGYLNASVPLHHIGGRGEAGMDLMWNLQPNWTAAYNGIPGGGGFIFAQLIPI